MNTQNEKPNWHKKPFWTRAAAIFTIAWVLFVVMVTEGDETHWLQHTMFLLPIAVWGTVLFVFRKADRDV